jgi:tetratricopeptide (TPR) repeat protein
MGRVTQPVGLSLWPRGFDLNAKTSILAGEELIADFRARNVMKAAIPFPGLWIFLTVFSLAGCSPASWRISEQAYRAGDMVRAVQYAVQTLRENPGYADALDFLSRQLPVTYESYEARARRAESAEDWDEAFALYQDITAMSDAVASLPPQRHEDTGQIVDLPTRTVDEGLRRTRNRAAEQHYAAGLRMEERGMAKEAAKEFSRTLEYIHDYKDAGQRYEANRRAAVMRIAVMPFDNLSGKDWYGALGSVVADQIISAAMERPQHMEFMEFVTREKIDELIRELKFEGSEYADPASAARIGKLLGIHAFVFGKITSIVTDYPPDIVETYREEDEISQGKDKPKKKVAATVTAISRRATAKVTTSYQIVDVERGTIVKSGTVPRLETVEIRFGRYRGDEEALSYRSKQLCAVRESFPPPDDEMVSRVTELAARELAREIAAFFR